MISVCQIYNDFKGASNTWQYGHFRPKSFEYALHEASIEIFNELRKEWQKSQIVSDNLRPFFKSAQKQISNLPKGGMIDYPDDYSMFSSLRFFTKATGGSGVLIDCDIIDDDRSCRPLREEDKVAMLAAEELVEHEISKIDNMRWGAFCAHQFIPPSLDNPGCTQYNDGFKVLPKKIGIVVLDYLAIPERPKFIYTKGPRNAFICDPLKCTNMLWGDEILPELMSRIKTKYASFVGNGAKYQEGQRETQIVGS